MKQKLHGCQLRWAFGLLVYLPFGEIDIAVVLIVTYTLAL